MTSCGLERERAVEPLSRLRRSDAGSHTFRRRSRPCSPALRGSSEAACSRCIERAIPVALPALDETEHLQRQLVVRRLPDSAASKAFAAPS